MSGTKPFPADNVKLHIASAADVPSGTMTVLMRTNRYYTDGSLLQTGVQYTVTKEWGQDALSRNWCEDVADVFPETETPSGLTAAQVAAIQPLVSGEGNFTSSGYKTVLFADSMTSQHYVDTTPTCSYAAATGVMTLTLSAHALPTGWPVDFYHRGYAALTAHVRKTVTRIDANTFSIQLDPGLSGVPDGALTGTGFARMPHRLASNGFFTWLQIASGWRFNLVYNGAQSGDRTDDNLARLQRDCLDYEPHVVFMQTAGINDMGNGTPDRDEETIFAAQKEIIRQILAVGARVVLLGMTPVASGESRATLQNMARVRRLNRRLEDWTKDYPRIVYFDSHRLIVDPTNTTGLADANLVKSTDFIHYSIRGAKKVADALWTQIEPLFPAPGDTLPTSAVDSMLTASVTLTSPTRSGNTVTSATTAHEFRTGERVKVYGGTSAVLNDYTTVTRIDADNLSFPVETAGADGAITGTVRLTRGRNMFGNPLLLTASGGTTSSPVTGTTAALVRTRVLAGSPTAVASVVARSDGFGNNQRLVITPAAADNRCSIELENSTTALVAQVKGGRRYFFQAHVTMTGVAGSNLSEMGFRLFMQWDGNNHSAFALDTYDSAPLNADWSGHVRTAEITLPVGVTVTQFYFEVAPRFSAAGTALTLEVGRIELVELE